MDLPGFGLLFTILILFVVVLVIDIVFVVIEVIVEVIVELEMNHKDPCPYAGPAAFGFSRFGGG
jgi:hypothetical protein